MFGLSNKPSEPGQDEEFELETQLKSVESRKAILEGIRDQMQALKSKLQSGESDETFQRLGLVLHGYVAALKVIDRVKTG